MQPPAASPEPSREELRHERTMIGLVGMVQFVNILDFVMVMPLGPSFAQALGIPTSHIGVVGGSYTMAAAVAGMIASRFLDRFDRRSALALAMLGLVCSTAAAGLATGMTSMVAARIMAGLCGGPAASLSMSIIADVIPPARRGRAMGTVMASFSIASTLGVPAGLALAEHGSWRTPFFAVAGLGAAVVAVALFVMPKMRGHLAEVERRRQGEKPPSLWSRPPVVVSHAAFACTMFASFVLIPNLSAYIQFNLGYPFHMLQWFYLVGGVASLISMIVAGRLVDRAGAFKVSLGGTLFFVAVLITGFVHPMPWPVMIFFVGFMVAASFRMVPLNVQSSRVPALHERARFMSTQSAVTHLSAGLGAMFGSVLLTETAGHKLVGVPLVASITVVFALLLPPLLRAVERHLRAQASAAVAEAPAA